jgi:hypothetical protein
MRGVAESGRLGLLVAVMTVSYRLPGVVINVAGKALER